MLVVDYIADRLVRAGVRHVFGVGGANIEDLWSAVQRRRPEIRAILGKHEHAAGTAADAYARLTGGLGVVMVTSGGAAMNLVHAIAEARASAVPLLAIVGDPPTELQGRGAFQDSSGRGDTPDGAAAFAAVARRCIRIGAPDEVPAALEEALAVALGPPAGPVVLLIPKEVQRTRIDAVDPPLASAPTGAELEPEPDAVRAAAARLRGRVVAIAGAAVARASVAREFAALVQHLDADVAVTPDARDAFDNHDPRFLGVVGPMGHAAVTRAIEEAEACLLVGTRLPLLARMGIEPILGGRPMVSLGAAPPFLPSPGSVHVGGDLRAVVVALTGAAVGPAPRRSLRARPELVAPASEPEGPLRAADVLSALGRRLPDRTTVLVDAGNTGAAAVHHLPLPADGRWLLAMGMAGMGWTFGAAIGAAHATGDRCVVVAGDGAFYMHGLEIHTAVEHGLPITYVLLDNAAHGMCLVRERLLLKENMGYNVFRRAHLGAGLSAAFPGLLAFDCRTLAQFQRALARALAEPGPCVLAVELPDVEIPPFTAFRRVAGEGVGKVAREGNDR
jgi:acetolactate synthase-1/2/3 large subunit